ncbi:MAG: beta-lactamase family protein [Pontiellaceae bacterium]|jgi:CubicO group peptidase (beta-lactamase class C family)|nr:beta-lactamase family protein [Pontiellaceae bacterium]
MKTTCRYLALGCALILSLTTQVRADPAAEAAEYHRDFQSEAEGIVIGTLADGTFRFGQAGHLCEGGAEVNSRTLFEIGSITKVFTGILLADAVLKGNASLDDPVSKFLPADLLAPDSPLHEVTLLDLTTHTSGLPREPADLDEGGNPADPWAHYSVERLYNYLKGFKKSDFKKRGEMSYSNLGVGLLGHLLERISGKPYGVLVKEIIFDPLEMKDSFVLRKPEEVPSDRAGQFATGHKGGEAVSHWYRDVFLGNGAIVSSAQDLMLFARAYFSEDLPPSLRAAMDLAAKPHRGEIGFGWFVGENSLQHGGAAGGFHCHLSLSLTEKTATIRLMNGKGQAPDAGGEGDFSGLAGCWEGTFDNGKVKLLQVLRISEAGRVVLHYLDQGLGGFPANKAFHGNGIFRASFADGLGASFEAKVEGDSLVGTWRWLDEPPLPETPETFVRAKGVPEALETALSQRITGDLSGVAGWWSGYVGDSKTGPFVILEIESIGKSSEARICSPDQSQEYHSVTKLDYADGQLKIEVKDLGKTGATYTAKLGANGELSGTWTQNSNSCSLTMTKSATRPVREK